MQFSSVIRYNLLSEEYRNDGKPMVELNEFQATLYRSISF